MKNIQSKSVRFGLSICNISLTAKTIQRPSSLQPLKNFHDSLPEYPSACRVGDCSERQSAMRIMYFRDVVVSASCGSHYHCIDDDVIAKCYCIVDIDVYIAVTSSINIFVTITKYSRNYI